MRSAPQPRYRYTLVIFEPFLHIETLIGEGGAGKTHALHKAGKVQRAAFPWVTRIVVDGVGVGQKAIAQLDLAR